MASIDDIVTVGNSLNKNISQLIVAFNNFLTIYTGVIDVANGGTGNSSLTANSVLTGNGTNPIVAEANFVCLDNGNVGIGNIAPSVKLDVTGAANISSDLTVDGIASFGDGSAATPSIAHKGDLNTGFWFPAADTIAASTAGSERMRISSSGNVGIGGLSPSVSLEVNNQATPQVRVLSTTNAVDTRMLSIGGSASAVIGTYSNHPLVFYSNTVERMRIDTSGYTQFSSNNVMQYQGAQTSKAAATTLTGPELITGILQYTGAAATVNLPTGATIEGSLTWSANNVCLDWSVINTGTGTCTIGANGNTTVGSLAVAAATSAMYRIRRTAANTFTVYRLS